MKYCQKCGSQIADDAAFCSHCGSAVTPSDSPATSEPSIFKTIAKIFMIVGCVVSAFPFLIPLCWTLPMTMHYIRAIKEHRHIGTEFKVCALIFVNIVAGILMLCDDED